MAAVSARLQQATLDAQAGQGASVLAAIEGEANQLEYGLYIDTPSEATALPACLVPFSGATSGEAAADSDSDSEELEVVEVGQVQGGAGEHDSATAGAATYLLD